jgi:tRNA (guanine26-N2/guanine27-N2)-dimethyltransferase
MSYGYPTKIIREGKARLIVPELDEASGIPIQQLRSAAPVFYNPHMKTNRDTAVLVLRAYQSEKKGPVSVCEPMTGCGVRGIRLLLETCNIESIILGDLNPSALKLALENANINEINNLIKFRELDANLIMSLHSYPRGRFDYVDIDPYGSPAPFINTAIRSTKNHGIIALTATDMAPLCGVNKKACLRKYGSWPLQSEFCHETAIRIMTGTMIRHSAMYEYAANPIFSFYSQHYIRAYYRIHKGAKKADNMLKQLGYIKYCPKCLNRETSRHNFTTICKCGEKMDLGGPLWLGELSDPLFLSKIINDLENLEYLRGSKAEKLIQMVRAEYGYPVGYYDIDKICKQVGLKSISTDRVLNALSSQGHLISKVHYSPRGLKTNAEIKEIEEIFQRFR